MKYSGDLNTNVDFSDLFDIRKKGNLTENHANINK
jgi:hypothetical protein